MAHFGVESRPDADGRDLGFFAGGTILSIQVSGQIDLGDTWLTGPDGSPASKLETAGWLPDTTLARRLGIEGADENELYGAMDWLLARQAKVEAALARFEPPEGETA